MKGPEVPNEKRKMTGISPAYLGPEFQSEEHEIYATQLLKALADSKVRNIALAGAYGTGKSSILQGLLEDLEPRNLRKSSKRAGTKKIRVNKPIFVSLTPFAHKQPHDFDDEVVDRLQQAVLHQLIFREHPSKIRKSKFRGILHLSRNRKWTNYLLISLLIITFLVFVRYQSSIFAWLENTIPEITNPFLALAFLFIPILVLALLIGAIDWAWVEKPRIKGLALGPGRVELDGEEQSFFGKYLAEIIYYFRASRVNLVIFEDLDRFESIEIFESLRELNLQVNTALDQDPHIWKLLSRIPFMQRIAEQRERPPLRFIYALRDSVFEPPGGQDLENETSTGSTDKDHENHDSNGAGVATESNVDSNAFDRKMTAENRTKFFDVIIPVVPFTTHRNAHEFLNEILTDTEIQADFEPPLLRIIGRHIVDHRLLSSIVYEFQIFRAQIVGGTDDNKLLAMTAYKNLHLKDFEDISRGTSDLDRLMDAHRDQVAETQKKISTRLKDLKAEKNRRAPQPDTIELLDRTLYEFLKEQRAPLTHEQFRNGTLAIGNETFSASLEGITAFWVAFATAPDLQELATRVTWQGANQGSYSYRGPIAIDANFIQKQIERHFGNRERILQTNYEEIRDEINTLETFARATRSSRIADFVEAAEKAQWTEIGQRARRALDRKINDHIDSGLGRELVKSGYIDSDFHLYAATFKAGLNTAEAQIFIANSIERIKPAPYQELEENACNAICSELAAYSFSDLTGALNADLLLALTRESKHAGSSAIVGRILDDSADHPQSTKHIPELVHAITQRVEHTQNAEVTEAAKRLLRAIAQRFPNLLSDELYELISAESLPSVVSVALAAIDCADIEISESFQKYLSDANETLDVFTDSNLDSEVVSNAVESVVEYLPECTDIGGLSDEAARSFAKFGLMQINTTNLTEFESRFNAKPSIVALHDFPGTFEVIAADPSTYVGALDELGLASITATESERFAKVVLPALCDLMEASNQDDDESSSSDSNCLAEELTPILKLADNDLIFHDVTDIDTRSYPALLRADLIAPTLANLMAYVREDFDIVESGMASLLNADGIVESHDQDSPEFDAESLKEVALAVIEPEKWPGGDEHRKKIIHKLGNDFDDVTWDEIGALTPSKIGVALHTGLVADSADSLEALNEQENSDLTTAFLENTEMQVEDFELSHFTVLERFSPLLENEDIDLKIRLQVVKFLSEPEMDSKNLQSDAKSILAFADKHDLELSSTFLLKLAVSKEQASTDDEFVELLASRVLALPEQDTDRAFFETLFESLGGDFADLLEVGGSYRDFRSLSGLSSLMKRAKSKLGTISQVKFEENGTTVRVTRRRSQR